MDSRIISTRCRSASFSSVCCLCGGLPLGRYQISSSPNSSYANSPNSRCPIWIGSNVPPMIPTFIPLPKPSWMMRTAIRSSFYRLCLPYIKRSSSRSPGRPGTGYAPPPVRQAPAGRPHSSGAR